jgi:ATP-dependent Clp protease ATP-binding subunit ClpC
MLTLLLGMSWLFALLICIYFVVRGSDVEFFMHPSLLLEGFREALGSGSGTERFFGLFCIFFSAWMSLVMLGWFKNSYYYHVEALLERGVSGAKTPYTTPNYETNDIFFHTTDGDLLASALKSTCGVEVMLRAGLRTDDVKRYLQERAVHVDFRLYPGIREVFTLKDVIGALVAFDQAFASFVFEKGVRPEDLTAASEWVEHMSKRARRRSRWWGRVALGQTRGIGSDLSYGVAYSLERYSTDLTRAVTSGKAEFRHVYGTDAITKMEVILSRGENANVLLVGSTGGSLMDVVIDFAHDIVNGFTHKSFTSAHIMLLDWKHLMSGMKTKQEFESRMERMMNSAVRAKNVIIAIDDIPGFIQSAATIGADVISLIDPYARAGRVQFIVTADMGRYHALLEPNEGFRMRFETLIIPEPERPALVRTLEDVAVHLEHVYRVLFTYPSIRAVHEGAQRYFVDAVMPDTALKLLEEIAPAVAGRGDHVVTYDDVMNYIQAKTGVPVGTISDQEREKLQNLESELHLHIIGQEKAVEVIANALRRSRAGVRNPNRPIGTFLFLGPTGVGKTEVAKALAAVFFGDESSMVRFDMSEFQSEDGLARLIGGIGVGAGLLSNALREHPFSVLLLDEFEKTHPKVLDLFLQIFDEGVYHDASGKKVNAQNTIMIATSNAGATLIRKAVAEGIPLESVEKEIVDGVIAEGKYKPELLNRFDGVVIFHPLTREDYRKIAMLMVEKLKKRLREQNIDIAVNDVLIEALLVKGVDPDFGARPMNRAVQELIEQTIAKKIIAGEIHPGMTVTFKREDFPGILP